MFLPKSNLTLWDYSIVKLLVNSSTHSFKASKQPISGPFQNVTYDREDGDQNKN